MTGIIVFQVVLLFITFKIILSIQKASFALMGLSCFEALKILILCFFSNNEDANPLVIDILAASAPLFLLVFLDKPGQAKKMQIIAFTLIPLYITRSFGVLTENTEILSYTNYFVISALLTVESICCFQLYKQKHAIAKSSTAVDLLKYLIMFSLLKSIMKLLKLFKAEGMEIPIGFGEKICWVLISAICLLLMVKILMITFKSQPNENEMVRNEDEDEKNSYQSSKLMPEDIQFITAEIQDYLNRTTKYLDPNFTLEKLSEQTAVPKHHISQAINSKLEKNFHGLMAEYRIRHSMILLEELNDIKVETLAHICGFNSVSSFYKNFKKINGMTPVEYMTKKSGSKIESL